MEIFCSSDIICLLTCFLEGIWSLWLLLIDLGLQEGLKAEPVILHMKTSFAQMFIITEYKLALCFVHLILIYCPYVEQILRSAWSKLGIELHCRNLIAIFVLRSLLTCLEKPP